MRLAPDQQCPVQRPPTLRELLLPPPPMLQSSVSMGAGRRLRAGDGWPPHVASEFAPAPPSDELGSASFTDDPDSTLRPGAPSAADVAPVYGGDAPDALPLEPLSESSFWPRAYDPDRDPFLQRLVAAQAGSRRAPVPAPAARGGPGPGANAGPAESAVQMRAWPTAGQSVWAVGADVTEGGWPLGRASGAQRHLQQEEPDVRKRSPPSPPPRLCDFGDPFRMPGQGGCCQACKMAAAKYTHFRDSDLMPMTCCLAIATKPAPPPPAA
eukprot:jgi/Botrbrau1/15233/Bobra.0149s0086.1